MPEEEQCFSFELGTTGKLTLKPAKQLTSKIEILAQQNKAFQIYMDIWMWKVSIQCVELVQYMANIYNLEAKFNFD